MGWLGGVWYSGGFEVTGQGNMQACSSPSIHSLFIFNFTSLSFFIFNAFYFSPSLLPENFLAKTANISSHIRTYFAVYEVGW
jgi:hypothetical protein